MTQSTKILPVIDWNQQSRLGQDSQSLQKELLVFFAKELPEVQTNINCYYETNHISELYDVLHKLQGGCAYCGLPRLRIAAAELSQAIKEKQSSLSELIQNINTEIDAVLSEIKLF